MLTQHCVRSNCSLISLTRDSVTLASTNKRMFAYLDNWLKPIWAHEFQEKGGWLGRDAKGCKKNKGTIDLYLLNLKRKEV